MHKVYDTLNKEAWRKATHKRRVIGGALTGAGVALAGGYGGYKLYKHLKKNK